MAEQTCGNCGNRRSYPVYKVNGQVVCGCLKYPTGFVYITDRCQDWKEATDEKPRA